MHGPNDHSPTALELARRAFVTTVKATSGAQRGWAKLVDQARRAAGSPAPAHGKRQSGRQRPASAEADCLRLSARSAHGADDAGRGRGHRPGRGRDGDRPPRSCLRDDLAADAVPPVASSAGCTALVSA